MKIIKGKQGRPACIEIELSNFSVRYSQDSSTNNKGILKKGRSKIVVDNGKILRISKDKDGKITKELLTKHWIDWIDYWAMDFDFERKRKIIRVVNEASGKTEEQWSGDYIFENEWQGFCTRKDRSLKHSSIAHERPSGQRKFEERYKRIYLETKNV